MNSTCYLASAGAGKTSLIIKETMGFLKDISCHKSIAIITFTQENQENILNRIKSEFQGIIPHRVKIYGWFQFLLKEIVKPFKGDFIEELYNRNIGFYFEEGHGGSIKKTSGNKYYRTYRQGDKKAKFFTSDYRVKSSMLPELAHKCLSLDCIKRIKAIYDYIFIDEAQDLAGWDLEIIKILLKNGLTCFLTLDPRQHLFNTHTDQKNNDYSGKIHDYLISKKGGCEKLITIDSNTLSSSHRCLQQICLFANLIFDDSLLMSQCICEKCNKRRELYKGPSGVFLVSEEQINYLVSMMEVMGLVWDKKHTMSSMPCKTFGDSKGAEFDAVIIRPTNTMLQWLSKGKAMNELTRNKFYVGVTRARYFVGILVNKDWEIGNCKLNWFTQC